MSDRAAFWVGLGAGGVLTLAFLLDKANKLAARGGAIQAGVEGLARKEVERVAKLAADDYMGQVYGLTPRRIAEIGQIAEAVQARLGR